MSTLEECGLRVYGIEQRHVTYTDRNTDSRFYRWLDFNKDHGHWCCEASFNEFVLRDDVTWADQEDEKVRNYRWSCAFGHWTSRVLCIDRDLVHAIAEKLDELERNGTGVVDDRIEF